MSTISQIDYTTTDACPLQCGFCYKGKPEDTRTFSRDHAETMLAFVLAQQPLREQDNRRTLKWTWMGGEPLTEKAAVKQCILDWRERYSDVHWYHKIVTNCVLLDEPFIAWAAQNHVYIHTSIDGCPEAQDAHRHFSDGRGSSEIVERNARLLFKYPFIRTARMTLSRETLPLWRRSMEYLYNVGFRRFSCQLSVGTKWTADDLDMIRSQMRLVADWWLEHARRDEFLYIDWLDDVLKKIWMPYRDSRSCMAGVSRIAVDTAGTFWPCAYFIGGRFPQWSLGDLTNGISDAGEMIRKAVAEYDHRNAPADQDRGCAECPAVNGCRRHCLYHAGALTGDLFGRTDDFCELTRARWDEALRIHSMLIAERSKTYPAQFRFQRKAKGSKMKSQAEKPKALIMKWDGSPGRHTERAQTALAQMGMEPIVFARNQNNVRIMKWVYANRPKCFVSFQRLYHTEENIHRALRNVGAKCLFMDFGIIPLQHYQHVIFDPEGGNATAQIAGGRFDELAATESGKRGIEKHLGQVDEIRAKLTELAGKAKPPPELIGKRFAVFFAQKCNECNLRFDSGRPWFQSPWEVGKGFVRTCRKADLFAVVKPHPKDKKWEWKIEGSADDHFAFPRKIEQNEEMNAWLMANAERVVTVNSTMLFNAMFVDRPISIVGRSWATGNGVVDEVLSFEDAIRERPALDWERRRRFLAFMLSRHAHEDELHDPKTWAAALRVLHPEVAVTAPKAQIAVPEMKPVSEPVKKSVQPTVGDACPPASCAFLLIGMGERHWPHLVRSVASLRTHEPETRIVVVTNLDWSIVKEAADKYRLEIVPVDVSSYDNRAVKTRQPFYVPPDVERCIYLDCDTTVTGPLREAFAFLDRYDLACCYDPIVPTIDRRRKRKSPQLTRLGIRRLYEMTGPGATMPQAGFVVWRRSEATLKFFADWYTRWSDLSATTSGRERGDSDSFAMALWQSDVRHLFLQPEYWQNGRGKGAKIEHYWGSLSRAVTVDPQRPPIITTIYVPEPEAQRYPDTPRLIRQCIDEGLRARRHICIDKAPDDLIEWFELMGHTIVEPVDGTPPRMARNLGKALALVEQDPFVWTIEQDVIVSAGAAAVLQERLKTLPPNVVSLSLRPTNREGKAVKPLNRGSHWRQPLEGHPDLNRLIFAPYCATLWRTDVLRKVPWDKIPALHSSDKKLGEWMRANEYVQAACPNQFAIHYPRSSWRTIARSGKD